MIGIIDLGLGNIKSIINAFNFIDAECTVITSLDNIDVYDGLVLPGVGAFGKGCEALAENSLGDRICNSVLEDGKPILGICLGMQLLAEISEETTGNRGLGLVKGGSYLIPSDGKGIKVPHIGWNDVNITNRKNLFDGITDPIFYFLHSYHVKLASPDIVTGVTNYGSDLAIAFSSENIHGVQFHPEKSQESGLQLLRNFNKIVEKS